MGLDVHIFAILRLSSYDTHTQVSRTPLQQNFIHIIHTTQVRVLMLRGARSAALSGAETPPHMDDGDDAVSSVHRRFA